MFIPKRLSAPVYVFLFSLFIHSYALAQCKMPAPGNSGFYGWEPGLPNAPNIIYYDLTEVKAGETWRDQIRLAMSDWNIANQSNGSNVRFEESDAGDSGHSIKFSTTWPSGAPAGRVGLTIYDQEGGRPKNTHIFLNASDISVFDANRSDAASTYLSAIRRAASHEVGLTMGLVDADGISADSNCGEQSAQNSIMSPACGTNYYANDTPVGPTDCDQKAVNYVYTHQPSLASSAPMAPLAQKALEGGSGGAEAGSNGESGGGGDPCEIDPICCGDPCCGDPCCGDLCCQCTLRCAQGNRWDCNDSPIIIDVDGDGYALTDGAHGVYFDLKGNGVREKVAWPRRGSDDAFLVLDRNGNGKIDDGREMFGSFTPQPSIANRNGFEALAIFDESQAGGNNDGYIDKEDKIFERLRLWRDKNHNGTTQPHELHKLSELHIESISLKYYEVARLDRHGNQFTHRALVQDTRYKRIARYAWDVFLLPAP